MECPLKAAFTVLKTVYHIILWHLNVCICMAFYVQLWMNIVVIKKKRKKKGGGASSHHIPDFRLQCWGHMESDCEGGIAMFFPVFLCAFFFFNIVQWTCFLQGALNPLIFLFSIPHITLNGVLICPIVKKFWWRDIIWLRSVIHYSIITYIDMV